MSTDQQDESKGLTISRWLAIVLLGPLVGALVLFFYVLINEPFWDSGDMLASLFQGLMLFVMIGWPTGFLPALASALIWAWLTPRIEGKGLRTLAVVAIGAITGGTLIWPFLIWFAGPYAPDSTIIVPAGVGGAVALLVTAQPWRWG